jgi:hypothetical protein
VPGGSGARAAAGRAAATRPPPTSSTSCSTCAAVDRGELVATSDSFAEYIERWLAEHGPRLEEGTYRDYRTHVERRLIPFFGERKLRLQGFFMRPGRFELPRPKRATRPSTLRVYQFRHRRVRRSV